MMDDLFGTEPSRNIFRLEPERKEALKARIALWNGLVWVFIHPLYNARSFYDIEEGLSRLVCMPSETVPPIIIFEEREYVKFLSLWLKHENRDTDFHCSMVETDLNDSTPFGYGEECRAYGWKTVTDKFKELGIRRILMGGGWLEIMKNPDWTGKPPYMEQCVGIALSHLSNKKGGEFEVELSSLIAPPEACTCFAP